MNRDKRNAEAGTELSASPGVVDTDSKRQTLVALLSTAPCCPEAKVTVQSCSLDCGASGNCPSSNYLERGGKPSKTHRLLGNSRGRRSQQTHLRGCIVCLQPRPPLAPQTTRVSRQRHTARLGLFPSLGECHVLFVTFFPCNISLSLSLSLSLPPHPTPDTQSHAPASPRSTRRC